MTIWAVEPLPFVPVMWIDRRGVLRVAEHVMSRSHALERGGDVMRPVAIARG